jgi:hypothetical protein
LHAEALQHMDMGMPAADQHQFLRYGLCKHGSAVAFS